MFLLSKRKPATTSSPAPAPPTEKVLLVANVIADAFSAMVASGQVQPGLIYDVSALPFPKQIIKNACIVTIRYSVSPEQLKGWMVVLPILSQFQEGVGSSPLGIDGAVITAGLAGGNVDELVRTVANMKKVPPELVAKVDAEFLDLLQCVEKEAKSR